LSLSVEKLVSKFAFKFNCTATPGEDDIALNAISFYFKPMENGGEVDTIGIDAQEAWRRRLVVKLNNAMATEEELALLKSSENEYGERLKVATDLVLLRLSKMYEGYGVTKVPKLLQPQKRGVKRKAPPISFFENQRTAFVKHCKDTKVYVRGDAGALFSEPDRASVQAWRAAATNLMGEVPIVMPEQTPAVASQGGVMSMFLSSFSS
jgi:hypothetical protein